ncbi:ATP-dependent permease [Gnomoniopsis sp. IMI 355080]|nr:ATP-dependent permease [Gnomoniopsis sp. IMI 355080]
MATTPSSTSGKSRNKDIAQSNYEYQEEVMKQTTQEPPSSKAKWRHIFSFTERRHTGTLVLAIVAAACAAGVKVSNAVFLGQFLDIDTSLGNGTMSPETASAKVAFVCIIFTALGAASWIFNWAFMTAWIIFGELNAKNVREKLFTNLLYKDMAWFDSQEKGVSSALSTIQFETRDLQLAASQVFGFLVTDICIAIGCLVLALYYSWELTLVLLGTVPVSMAVLVLVDRGLDAAIEAQKTELAQAAKVVTAAVTAIDLVKVYNGFDNEVWQYMQIVKRARTHFLQQARRNSMQMGYIKFWMVGLFVVGFYFAVYLVNKGSITAGESMTTFYSAMTALQALEGFGPQWIVLAKGISAGKSLQTIALDMAQRHKKSRGMKGSLRPEKCSGDIELHNVSFAYPSNPDKLVLSPSSFFFAAGEITFLVGKSGSGKSTLSNLILKFYNPRTGSILIDGHPVEVLADDWVRSNITLIQQSSILFNDSIFMNVAFGGHDPSRVTREQVQAACDMAMLQSAIAGLPDGLDTNVGTGGHNLSGGQKQRLALARAKIRDPPVLILDEVTSGLDPVSRVLILEAIRIWRAGKTTIIITHDVNQIQNEDYVYVMDKAVLLQEGYRKNLLMDDGGMFATMVTLTEGHGTSSASSLTSESSSPDVSDSELVPEEIPTANSRGSRLSRLFLQQSDKDTRNSGIFSIGVGGGRSSMMMLGKDIWSTPNSPTASGIGRSLQRRSNHELRHGRRNGHLQTNRKRRSHRTDRNSLDIIRERGEATIARRIPVLRSKPGHNRQPPATYDRKGSTDTIFAELVPEDSPTEQKRANRGKEKELSLAKILGTVWPLLSKRDRFRAIVGILASLVVAAANPAFSYVFTQLLAIFWSTISPTQKSSDGLAWAIRLLIVAVVDGVSMFTANYTLQCVGQSWVDSLRVEALKRILTQPKEFFDKPRHSPALIVEVLDRNAEEMRNLVGKFVPICIMVAGMVLASVTWALIASWKLTLVMMASFPVVYAATRSSAEISSKWEARTNTMGEAAGSVSSETFMNIRVVRALTLENYFSHKHASTADDAYRVGTQRALWTGLFYGLSQALSWWDTALIIWYATVLITMKGSTTTITSVTTTINLLLFAIGTAAANLGNMPQLAQAKATAIQILYYATLSYRNSHEGRGEERVLTPFPVEMRGLQFAYHAAQANEEGPHKVLRNVNLLINQGEYVTIVGASGCGKSTIANLLLRLYEPLGSPATDGTTRDSIHTDFVSRPAQTRALHPASLSFAHIPAHEVSTPILRTHIASVPQHAFLFPTSVLENIVYGLHPDSPYRSMTAVVAAAKLACIHDFIISLPNGYLTFVGEGGVGLSGGQAQRLSIARALVRRPKLLILDEPTSALDAEGSESVRIALKGLIDESRKATTADKLTVVCVTHSREMMRMAERIVVMDQGFVAEEGAYEELLGRRGKFADLVGGGAWMPSGVSESKSKGHKNTQVHTKKQNKAMDEEMNVEEDDQWWQNDSNEITIMTNPFELEDHFIQADRISTARENALRKLEGPPRQVEIRKGSRG